MLSSGLRTETRDDGTVRGSYSHSPQTLQVDERLRRNLADLIVLEAPETTRSNFILDVQVSTKHDSLDSNVEYTRHMWLTGKIKTRHMIQGTRDVSGVISVAFLCCKVRGECCISLRPNSNSDANRSEALEQAYGGVEFGAIGIDAIAQESLPGVTDTWIQHISSSKTTESSYRVKDLGA